MALIDLEEVGYHNGFAILFPWLISIVTMKVRMPLRVACYENLPIPAHLLLLILFIICLCTFDLSSNSREDQCEGGDLYLELPSVASDIGVNQMIEKKKY